MHTVLWVSVSGLGLRGSAAGGLTHPHPSRTFNAPSHPTQRHITPQRNRSVTQKSMTSSPRSCWPRLPQSTPTWQQQQTGTAAAVAAVGLRPRSLLTRAPTGPRCLQRRSPCCCSSSCCPMRRWVGVTAVWGPDGGGGSGRTGRLSSDAQDAPSGPTTHTHAHARAHTHTHTDTHTHTHTHRCRAWRRWLARWRRPLLRVLPRRKSLVGTCLTSSWTPSRYRAQQGPA
jgi:hypothetical protein